MTKLELPYSIGDKVWTIECFSYTREVGCLFCQTIGRVTLANGSKMSCGVCRGTGAHCIHKERKYRPKYHEITGYDVEHKKGDSYPEVGWFLEGSYSHYPHPSDTLYLTFYAARKAARVANKEYGWPKKDYQREWPDKHQMYWGYRVKK